MQQLLNLIKRQQSNFKLYKTELRQMTVKMQTRMFLFIALLYSANLFMDTSFLFDSTPKILNAGQIFSILLIAYFVLTTIVMYFLGKYCAKLVLPFAYFNQIATAILIILGSFTEGVTYSISIFISLSLLPAFTIYAPTYIFSFIFFLTITADLFVELNFVGLEDAFPYLVYYYFESFCTLLIASFINFLTFENKVQQLEVIKVYRRIADNDELTGLLNRKGIVATVSNYQNISGKYAMLVIDVDAFKQVNDAYGHLVGDEVLKNLAQALKKTFCRGESLGRFGGDEFIVFAPCNDDKYLKEMQSELIQNFEDISKDSVACSFSMGSAVIDNDKQHDLFDTLFDTADKQMYVNKQSKK